MVVRGSLRARDGSRLAGTIPPMERVTSRQNPLVRRFRAVARGAGSEDAALLDGPHLLHEALRSNAVLEMVAIADDADADAQALADESARRGVRVVGISSGVLAAISPVPQP